MTRLSAPIFDESVYQVISFVYDNIYYVNTIYPGHLAVKFTAYCFELVLQDAPQV